MKWLILVAAVFALASFLSVWSYGRFAKAVQGAPSYALAVADDATELDRTIAPLLHANPQQAGIRLITNNLDAFVIRALTVRNAGRSLDAMYYIWHDDLTGSLLDAELLAAADRGVRVRLLLDDMTAHGSHNARLAALDSHANIEVRLFNPTRQRTNAFARGMDMLLRSWSATRRMHNKAWIADNRIAVVGGRNIGDEYFDAAADTNFLDADIAMIGAPVAQASQWFDAYWNDLAALPVSALVQVSEAKHQQRLQQIYAYAQSAPAKQWQAHVHAAHRAESLLRKGGKLYWLDETDVRVVADPAGKVRGEDRPAWLLPILAETMMRAERRLEVVSPYFVPGEGGLFLVAALRARGVDVGIVTNSLAANDVVAVHSGYAQYRVPLLHIGAQLYELKPHDGEKTKNSLFGSSGASLHTKAFVVDADTGFVGSFNMDPRSAMLNTEMGVIFRHPEAVSALQALVQAKRSAQTSYHLQLTNDAQLRWRDVQSGGEKIWRTEPEASGWLRAQSRVIGWLPIESQL